MPINEITEDCRPDLLATEDRLLAENKELRARLALTKLELDQLRKNFITPRLHRRVANA